MADDKPFARWNKICELKSQPEFSEELVKLYTDSPLKYYVRVLFSDWFEQKWSKVQIEVLDKETAVQLLKELLDDCEKHPSNTNNPYHMEVVSDLKQNLQDPVCFVQTMLQILKAESQLVERYSEPERSEGSISKSHDGIEELEQMQCKFHELLHDMKANCENRTACETEISRLSDLLRNAESIAGQLEMHNGIQNQDVDSRLANTRVTIKNLNQGILAIDQEINTYRKEINEQLKKMLEQSKNILSGLLIDLKDWKKRRQRQYVCLIHPEKCSLSPLDIWCGKFGKICYQMLKDILELLQTNQLNDSSLGQRALDQLQTLLGSTFIVTNQVEHQIRVSNVKSKKLSCPKFYATVRVLGADMIENLSECSVRAEFIQKNAVEASSSKSTENLVGNNAFLKKTKSVREARFEALQLTEISRSSKAVCEVRYRLVFTTCLDLLGFSFQLKTASLPLVVVTGNMNLQGLDALCGITWQCFMSEDAFAIDEEPVLSAPGSEVCEMMDHKLKYMCGRGLEPEQRNHLMFQITGKELQDYSAEKISLKQLLEKKYVYKDTETNTKKNFNFWTWFSNLCILIQKFLKPYWEAGLIMGFISKSNAEKKLKELDKESTFILRFCDTVPDGAIHVALYDGKKNSQHLNPFKVQALEFTGLANILLDNPVFGVCKYLYPGDSTAQEAFSNIKEKPTGVQKTVNGYVPIEGFSQLKIEQNSSPSTVMLPQTLKHSVDPTRKRQIDSNFELQTKCKKLQTGVSNSHRVTGGNISYLIGSNSDSGGAIQVNNPQAVHGNMGLNSATTGIVSAQNIPRGEEICNADNQNPQAVQGNIDLDSAAIDDNFTFYENSLMTVDDLDNLDNIFQDSTQ